MTAVDGQYPDSQRLRRRQVRESSSVLPAPQCLVGVPIRASSPESPCSWAAPDSPRETAREWRGAARALRVGDRRRHREDDRADQGSLRPDLQSVGVLTRTLGSSPAAACYDGGSYGARAAPRPTGQDLLLAPASTRRAPSWQTPEVA